MVEEPMFLSETPLCYTLRCSSLVFCRSPSIKKDFRFLVKIGGDR